MSVTLRWTGLAELRAKLQRLPQDLAEDAAGLIHPTALALRDEVRARYPVHTGNLQSHVVVRAAKAPHAGVVAYAVVSTARHGWLFEYGTKPRRTRLGANRGFMPAADIFVNLAIRHRARLTGQLHAMVERQGLTIRQGATRGGSGVGL
jgi:hypothetical protein